MMQEQIVEIVWYGKDYMHVVYRQQIGFTFCQPLLTVNAATFGAVPVTTTVVDNLFIGTLITIFHSSSHCLGSALLQCIQHPQVMIEQGFLTVKIWQEVFYDRCDFSFLVVAHGFGFSYNLSSNP